MKMTKYMGMALAIATLAACSNDEDFTSAWQNDPAAMKVNATVGSGIFTRSNPLGDETAQKAFNDGDKISIAAGTQGAVTYTLTGGVWTPETGKYLKWEAGTMDIIAYYPVVGGVSAQAFTLPDDQGSNDKIVAADYMTFSGSKSKPADNGVLTMEMARKMARVIVRIAGFNDQYGSTVPTVADVKIQSGAASYTAGAAAGAITAVTPYAQNLSRTAAQAGTTYTALVIPTTGSTAESFITLTVNGTALTVKGIPAMEAGKSYTYSLTIGKDALTVGAVTVAPWGDGTIDGGEAEVDYTWDISKVDAASMTDEAIASHVDNGTLKLTGSFGSTENDAQEKFSKIAAYIRSHTGGSDAVTALDFGETTGVTTISRYYYGDGSNQYYECQLNGSALVSVNLPASVTTLDGAFSGCTALTTVTGGENVTSGSVAFSGCTALATAPSLPKLTTLYDTFSSSGLTTYSSDIVTKLQGQVFASCTQLTSVSCPKAVYLQNNLFHSCNSLTSITLTAETFSYVRAFVANNGSNTDPFNGIQNRGNVTLRLNASQKNNITTPSEGKPEWRPVAQATAENNTGLDIPVDLSGFKAVYCGTEQVYPVQ